MNKERTLSQSISRANFKELRQIIKMGLIWGNLIPAFVGAWLAVIMTNHSFLSSIPQILSMLLGSTLTMGGTCALNSYYDQDIDRVIPSKQNRPTVNNRITSQSLLLLGFGMMLVEEICLFLLNIPSGVLGLIGTVSYMPYYSIWSKRHTTWSTVTGNLPGAVPPLIGWVAIEGQINLTAIALFLVVLCWQPVHFYALVIKRKNGYALADIPMLPSIKGFRHTRVSMFIWLITLLPVPLLLISLGAVSVVLATLLNLGWTTLGLTTFKKNPDQIRWAAQMFIYSLNYLVVFFVLAVIVLLLALI